MAKQEPIMVDTKQAAHMMGLSPITLRSWRNKGCGPAFYKIGASIRYKVAHIEKFLAHCKNGGRK